MGVVGMREKYVHLGFKENGQFIRKQHLIWVNTGIIIKQQRREGGLMDFKAWSLSGRMP